MFGCIGKKDRFDEEWEKTAYRDTCNRNAIKDRSGDLKRRFGPDRIRSILRETAEVEAAPAISAMNAPRRLLRVLLFRMGFPVPVCVFQ